MRVATYVRVSTQQQDMTLQTAELGQYIASRGWSQADHYEDVISGAKANRPGLSRLMADAQARKFDVLLCWKLDRFGRSLSYCKSAIEGCGPMACGLLPRARESTRINRILPPNSSCTS